MGWGRRASENDGYFDFLTVMPGGFEDPVAKAVRAPHINISVTGSGLMRRLTTTLFFPDQPANAGDPVFTAVTGPAARSRLLLAPATSDKAPAGAKAFRIDLVLQGEEEVVGEAEAADWTRKRKSLRRKARQRLRRRRSQRASLTTWVRKSRKRRR
jgi:protocatechuate 3,4-dioxygenase alpha subunit